MRILVIGGTNFIGPHVIRELVRRGHEVTVFHRGAHEAAFPADVEHVHSPDAAIPVLRFPKELTSRETGVVLHMFPVGEADSRAVMDSFRERTRRVVAISSGDVYRAYGIFFGLEAGAVERVPLSEESPLRSVLLAHKEMAAQIGDWAKTYEKILVEKVVMSYSDLPGTVLRLPAVYGEGDPMQRFAQFLVRMQRYPERYLIGEDEAEWRWTHGHVKDVAHAIALAVVDEGSAGRTYNVGELETPTLEERLHDIARVVGWKGTIVRVPSASLPAELRQPFNYKQSIWCDSSRIRAELAYSEKEDYDDALRRTVEWQMALLRSTASA